MILVLSTIGAITAGPKGTIHKKLSLTNFKLIEELQQVTEVQVETPF